MRKGLLAELGVGASYLLLVLAFFWQPLFLPNVLVPKGGGDLASFLYPMYSFAARHLQQGVIPFWNPHLFAGNPFAADMQSGLFYPVNLVTFLLARPFSYATLEFLALFHYWLGAVLAYAGGRLLGLGRFGAFAFGALFVFGGFAVAHLGHLNMLEATVWLPLSFGLLHRALRQPSLAAAVGAGASFGISILAGHIQISLYTGLFLGLYWLWGLVLSRGEAGGLRRLLVFPIIGLVAVGVSAILWIPASELTSLSIRSELPFSWAVEYAASALGLINLVVPHFFGGNPSEFWGVSGNLTETYGYAGIFALVLGVAGLILPRRASPERLFLALAAVFFLLLSLGEQTALFGWLYRFVPGFDKVRAPGRFVVFFDLSVALLAAFSLEALREGLGWRQRPRFRALLRGTGLVLGGGLFLASPFFYHALMTSQAEDPIIFRRLAEAIASLNLTLLFLGLGLGLLLAYRWRWRRWLAYPMLGLALLDLFSANIAYNPTEENILQDFSHPQVVQFLNDQDGPFRIDTTTGVYGRWQPDLALLYGLDDVMGLFNPMQLETHRRYWENLGKDGVDPRTVPAYDLLNVKYLVAPKEVVLDWRKYLPVLTDAPGVNLFRNLTPLPRALVVPQAQTLERDKILARVRAKDFNPEEVLLLEPGVGPPVEEAGAGIGEWTSGPVVASAPRYPTVNEVEVVASSLLPAYLLLSEVFYPGWRATVDGQEVPVLRANYLFRAVALPAGEHRVRFFFAPQRWELALGLTLASSLGVVALLLGRAAMTWRRSAS